MLRRLQVRFRLREAARLAPVALNLGLAAALAMSALWRITPWMPLPGLLVACGALVIAALLAELGYALLRPRDLMATARLADHALSLDERLSTALEDATRSMPAQSVLLGAQLDDALQVALGIAPAHDLPLRAEGKKTLPGVLLLLLVAAVLFVPNPFLPAQDRTAQNQIRTEQNNIQALQKAIEASPRKGDPDLQALLKELSQLSNDLSGRNLSREQALARLSDAESRLQKALDAQAPAQREALDQLAKQLATSQSQAARQAGEALKSGDANKAADVLKKAGQDAASMDPQQRQALAQSLQKARDNVAALDPALAQRLNDAANALNSNDPQAAQNALDNLGRQTQDTGNRLATQQEIQQALAQIQQSKTNIAQAGQPTAIANVTPGAAPAESTVQAYNGTPVSGTPVAAQGSLISDGTPVTLGSPVSGQAARTGTPVLLQGTPGAGTPVAVAAQGQGAGNVGQGQGNGGQGAAQGGSGWGVGRQEPVYAPPSSINAALTPVVVQGQDNPNGEQSSASTNTNANSTGSALVPYEQVYGQYQQAAGQALGSDYIPQGYKDLVRDYFSNIAPQSQPGDNKP